MGLFDRGTTKTVYTANLPDYESMTPFELRRLEVLGRKGMLPPVTTTASTIDIPKMSGWKAGALTYGANVGGSLAGKKMSEALGASEAASDIIGTTTGIGAGLLAARMAGLSTGPIGIATTVGLSALPFIISAFNDDNKQESKPDGKKQGSEAIAKSNPNVNPEQIATEIDLLDQMAKKTKSDYEKAMAPINALASGYTDPMNPKGIDFSRVEKNVKALGDAALSYSAGKALGALYVSAGLQGGLDMVDKNSLLSADTFNKMKQMTAAMVSAKNGNREAAGSLRQMMGDLEAIGLKNRDVLSAVGMAADMNIKLANQLNDLAIAKQRVQTKTETRTPNENAMMQNITKMRADAIQQLQFDYKNGVVKTEKEYLDRSKQIESQYQNAIKQLSNSAYKQFASGTSGTKQATFNLSTLQQANK